MTFTYTVVSADSDDNGVSIAANVLDLNSGTIKDAAGLAAALAHSAVDASASHKVDGSIAAGQPKANAGSDQVVAQEAAVTLTGSGTDPNSGQTLTYAWSQTAPMTGSGSGLSLTNANTAQASFNAPTIAAGSSDITLTFQLEVTDSGTPPLTDTDDVTVTVTRQAVVSGVTISGAGRHRPQHLCAGRNYIGGGAVQRKCHGGHHGRNAATGHRHRQRHPPGQLRLKRQYRQHADFHLHGGVDGYGRQRHQHRRRRPVPEQRHH